MAQCIVTLVKKNMDLVRENEEYASSRYERLRTELKSLQQSSKLVQYIRDLDVTPQFVDRKN